MNTFVVVVVSLFHIINSWTTCGGSSQQPPNQTYYKVRGDDIKKVVLGMYRKVGDTPPPPPPLQLRYNYLFLLEDFFASKSLILKTIVSNKPAKIIERFYAKSAGQSTFDNPLDRANYVNVKVLSSPQPSHSTWLKVKEKVYRLSSSCYPFYFLNLSSPHLPITPQPPDTPQLLLYLVWHKVLAGHLSPSNSDGGPV